MKTRAIFLLVALFALSTGIYAQGWSKNKSRRSVPVERRYSHNTRVSTPRNVRTVAVLPYGHSEIRYNNVVYYYSKGSYYRPISNRYYEIVLPQLGMIVPELPHYRTVRYNGRTYYAHENYLYSRVRTPYGLSFRVDVRL